MNLLLHLAWKNLWRNKKRTLIALASIFFAVILSLLTRSMQHGTYDRMIDVYVRIYTGHIRIHGKESWEKPSLDKSIFISQDKLKQIKAIEHVNEIAVKIETFSLVSKDDNTKPSYVFGIDPEVEKNFSRLDKNLVRGEFLSDTSKGVLIAEGLAEKLKADLGDTIILYSQGYHGVTAAGQYVVTGIIKYLFPDNNDGTVVMTNNEAQYLFSLDQLFTAVTILVDSDNNTEKVIGKIKEIFNDTYDIKTWRELMPEIEQSIQMDNVSGMIMLFILYVVIGFGIFGTIMMMTAERVREFGVLIAVGMKRKTLIAVTTIETVLISLVGSLAGIIGAYPILLYLYYYPIELSGETAEAMLQFGTEPIIPFSLKPGIFVAQYSIVLLIAIASSIYPFLVIRKLQPVKAIRK